MVKINFRILLLLIGILSIPVVFSSCKSTKSSTKSTPQKPEVAQPVPQPPVVKEKEDIKKDQLVKMRFVMIMPFELEKNFVTSIDETTEPEINPSSLGALNFYEGALIAVDSLKSQKVEVKLNSYDTPSDSAGVVRMMTNAVVKDADLVIASLPNNLAEVAARIAKTNNIKLVLTSAGSPQLLSDNENVALAYASTKTQCREMVAFMLDQYTNANIILLFRTTRREDELASIFREEILKLKGDSDFQDFNATKKEYKDITGLLSKTKRNLVFVISSDEAFVSPVLALLEEQNIFGIKVSGLPTWLNFESIDFNMLNNLQVHLFDNNFIDTDEKEKSMFRKSFVSRYYSDPLSNAYNGFDIVYRLGLSLRQEYTGMENLMMSSFKSGNENYNFVSTGSGGIENKSISVLKITDYKLERLNK
ncbi:MAG: hypothetical protein M3Q95_14130 [Bacteroidota bacterium]|nr:hypothetical protein [Bacteroidota bacterium]